MNTFEKMFRFWILGLALAVAVSAASISDEETVTGDETTVQRIVGGSAVAITRFPWQLSVRINNNHNCGATLISTTWAVSAAHCFTTTSTTGVTVLAGTANRLSGGVLRNVRRIINHPQYNVGGFENNDISLLELASAVSFSNSIRPATLPSQGEGISTGTYTWVSGWGAQSSGSTTLPALLYAVAIPVVDQTVCNRLYGGMITSNMLCAGYLAGGKDACQHDSGGPLTTPAGRLVGVVSFGAGCANANSPGVYARVANYRNWIAQTTGV